MQAGLPAALGPPWAAAPGQGGERSLRPAGRCPTSAGKVSLGQKGRRRPPTPGLTGVCGGALRRGRRGWPCGDTAAGSCLPTSTAQTVNNTQNNMVSRVQSLLEYHVRKVQGPVPQHLSGRESRESPRT